MPFFLGLIMATSKPDDEILEEDEGAEETVELHGVINLQEASRHVLSLDETLNNMVARIKAGEEKDVLKDAVMQFKDTISRSVPQMGDADIAKVICSVGNPKCLALRPRTEERVEMLELVMPLKDTPGGEEVVASIEKDTPLTDSQQNLLREVFKDLKVAHEHTGRACSHLACLSMTLNPSQLMTTLKATTCPLIQINTLEGFLDKPGAPRRLELPDDTETRVRITMTPNPNVKDLLKGEREQPNSLASGYVRPTNCCINSQME